MLMFKSKYLINSLDKQKYLVKKRYISKCDEFIVNWYNIEDFFNFFVFF